MLLARWRKRFRPELRTAFWVGDLRNTQIVRFTVGVTLAAALAFAIQWPLSFLLPVLTGVFLGNPIPGPTFKRALVNIGYVLAAFVLGLTFTLFFLPFPLVYVAMVGVVLFHIYYLLNRGGPFIFVLMALLALLLLPMLAQIHDVLAEGFAAGFVVSGALVVVLFWFMHQVFPNPEKSVKSSGFQPGYSPVAAQAALKSAVVVLPLVVLFIIMQWTGQILVMVYAAVISLSPELSAGRAMGKKLLIATLMGGVVALLFFHMLASVPEYWFLILLVFVAALWFAQNMFSDKPNAKYYPSAFTALLILVSTSMGEGSNIEAKFALRVLFIALASGYVILALHVLDRFWPQLRR